MLVIVSQALLLILSTLGDTEVDRQTLHPAEQNVRWPVTTFRKHGEATA